MDKLAYHLNKKKIPAKTEGKYKYYYPCLLKEEADEQYGDNYYIVTEVSEREWEALLELDRLEYNNTHKFTRHSSMPDKNKTNLAKTPQFPRFFVKFSLEVRQVRLRSPLPKIIENIGVLVADKSGSEFLC